jgi:hypothetical protein
MCKHHVAIIPPVSMFATVGLSMTSDASTTAHGLTNESLLATQSGLCSLYKPELVHKKLAEMTATGYAGLCHFCMGLSPGLRLTMHQMRGLLIHTRLWCCDGLDSQQLQQYRLNATDVLKACNLLPVKIMCAPLASAERLDKDLPSTSAVRGTVHRSRCVSAKNANSTARKCSMCGMHTEPHVA